MARIKKQRLKRIQDKKVTVHCRRLKHRNIPQFKVLEESEEPVVKLVPVFKTKQQEERFAEAREKNRSNGAKLVW